MKATRFGTLLLAGATALTLLVIAGAIDIDVRWQGNTAQAIDFFGSDDGEDGAGSGSDTPGAFWSEESDEPPIAPRGVWQAPQWAGPSAR